MKLVVNGRNILNHVYTTPRFKSNSPPAATTFQDSDIEKYPSMHVSDGELQPDIRTPEECLEKCQAPCQAVDFNSLTATCWFHEQDTACLPLFNKDSCTHYRKVSCEPILIPPPEPTEHQCGQCSAALNISRLRIVGGMEAEPHSWPWMVGLFTQGFQVCGGSLVSSRYVVTAAHCFFGDRNPANWIIRLGDHNQNVIEAPEIEIRATEIAIHSQYDEISQDYDIAVVKLERDVTASEDIAPVCIPASDIQFQDGMECIATGWGDTRGTSTSGVLNQVMVPIVNQELCNSVTWYNGIITSRMICAGYEEGRRDSCQGDSGGPLVCKIEDVWFLSGITSFGEDCAQPRRPGVYTRVTQMVGWLALNTDL